MSKKRWSAVNFIVSIVVVIVAFLIFSERGADLPDKTAPANTLPPGEIKSESPAGQAATIEASGSVKAAAPIVTLSPAPDQVIQAAAPAAGTAPPKIGPQTAGEILSAEMANQLKAPPPELPEDLRRQLEAPPPELPDDLKAQLNAPPPPIPDDIKRALATPARVVSIEEVNGPAAAAADPEQIAPEQSAPQLPDPGSN